MAARPQKQRRWLVLGFVLLLGGVFLGVKRMPSLGKDNETWSIERASTEGLVEGGEQESLSSAKSNNVLKAAQKNAEDLLPQLANEMGLISISVEEASHLFNLEPIEYGQNHVFSREEAIPILQQALESGALSQNVIVKCEDNEEWAADWSQAKFEVSANLSALRDSMIRFSVRVGYQESSLAEGVDWSEAAMDTIFRIPQGELMLLRNQHWDEALLLAAPVALEEKPIPIEILKTLSPEAREYLTR